MKQERDKNVNTHKFFVTLQFQEERKKQANEMNKNNTDDLSG